MFCLRSFRTYPARVIDEPGRSDGKESNATGGRAGAFHSSSPSSSHSRQTHSPRRSSSALSSTGTIVTPQREQIGGRSSSSTARLSAGDDETRRAIVDPAGSSVGIEHAVCLTALTASCGDWRRVSVTGQSGRSPSPYPVTCCFRRGADPRLRSFPRIATGRHLTSRQTSPARPCVQAA